MNWWLWYRQNKTKHNGSPSLLWGEMKWFFRSTQHIKAKVRPRNGVDENMIGGVLQAALLITKKERRGWTKKRVASIREMRYSSDPSRYLSNTNKSWLCEEREYWRWNKEALIVAGRGWLCLVIAGNNNPQEKKQRSTVLNARRTKFYDFQVLTGALHMVYHESSALFKNYTRYFFQREASSESGCNRSFQG